MSIFRYRTYLTLGHLLLAGKASVISNNDNKYNSNKSGKRRKCILRAWPVLVVLGAEEVAGGYPTNAILLPLNNFIA